MMIKNSAHMMRTLALITIITLSFLAPARSAISIDGDGSEWQPGYFQIQDGTGDIGADFDSGYEITKLRIYYESDKLYFMMNFRGLPGDADGDGNVDTALPTDQPGVGINEIYRLRVDKNKDGIWDMTIEYSNNVLHVYGVSSDKVAFAYGDVVEASLSDIASLGINPYSFRIYAYAGTSLDGLPEDVLPATDVNLSPSLQLAKSVDKQEGLPGDILTYTISYSNVGYSNATGVIITDNIPSNTTYVSGGTLSGNTARWNIGTLGVGQSGSVTLKISIITPLDNGTVIRNIATIESDQTIPKTSQAETTVRSSPILSIEKTGSPDPVPVNTNLTYTIAYSNTGDMNATNVIIREYYPQGVTFVSSVPDATSGNSEWHIGTLNAGASGSITLTVRVGNVQEGTLLTNRVTITSDQTEDETTTTTTVSSVKLSIEKSDSPDPVNAGQNLTYTLSYSNTGTASATNVVITEAYDTNVTFVSSLPQPDSGTTNRFTFGTIASGASGTITIVVRVSPAVPNGGTLTNTARIDSNETEPVSDTETTTVLSLPALSIIKEVDKSTSKPGETLTYAITVRNTGTAEATGVTISDAVPSSTTLLPDSITEGGSGTSTIVWNVGALAPQQAKVVGFKAKIAQDFTGMVTNIAILDSDQTDPLSDDANTMVEMKVIVDILLSPPSQIKEVESCETAVFPITVLNRGTMADTIALTHTEPPAGWSASLDKDSLTLDSGKSTMIYLSVGSCVTTGQATVGVTGRSGNDISVTSSVSTLTKIKGGNATSQNSGTQGGNSLSLNARQNLIIVNVKSGSTYFLKNSMAANPIEPSGKSIALQVDVSNRGLRTAHDVTLSFKNNNVDFTVKPLKQDIVGRKTVTFDVTLNFSEFPEGLVIFADGREDVSGTYKMKVKPPPPAPEPAVVRPTPAPIMPKPMPGPVQSSVPTMQPQTPQPTSAPTVAPAQETPTQEPSFYDRMRRRASDSMRAAAGYTQKTAPYALAILTAALMLIILFKTKEKIRDVISSILETFKRIRVPRIVPQRRPRPTPRKPLRSGIPGRKHKFVLETEGF